MGENVFYLPYENITSVEVKSHFLEGYFELSAGGVESAPKSYWSHNKSLDAKAAPNCISLTFDLKRKFQDACTYILGEQARRRTAERGAWAGVQNEASKTDVVNALERLAGL